MKRCKWKAVFAWVAVFSFILDTAPVPASASNVIADRVYINGDVRTMDRNRPKADTLAVKGQVLIYVGDQEEIKEHIGNNTRVTDLQGKTVIPATAALKAGTPADFVILDGD